MQRESVPLSIDRGVGAVAGRRHGVATHTLTDKAVREFEREQRIARRNIRQARAGARSRVQQTRQAVQRAATETHGKLTALGRLQYAITTDDLSDSQRERMVAAILAGH